MVEPPDPAVALFYQSAAPLILGSNDSMRFFVAYLDGVPAAVSGLYLEGGVGGIYSVATRRKFRRRRIGSRITWAAADEARRAGAELAVLQASADGKETSGWAFETAASLPNTHRLARKPCLLPRNQSETSLTRGPT
jgi:ribosomal protein S18 acetylase RimI-like enzyme